VVEYLLDKQEALSLIPSTPKKGGGGTARTVTYSCLLCAQCHTFNISLIFPTSLKDKKTKLKMSHQLVQVGQLMSHKARYLIWVYLAP
jgi:hypothetical protein